MKIGIDSRFAVHRRRGIGNYTLKLIQYIAKIDGKNDYILYTDREDIDHVLPQTKNFKIKELRPSNYLVWEQIMLPFQAARDAVQILHCTGNTAPLLIDRRIKVIATVHDVMYLKNYTDLPKSSSVYQGMGRMYRKAIVPRAARRISMLLTVSEYSKKDIMRHLPDLNETRIKAIYEAANEKYQRVDKATALRKINHQYHIDRNYILTLGALDPRKNTKLVIASYMELKCNNLINEKLVIVGIPNWKQTPYYRLVQDSNVREDIVFTDYVSEDDLVSLYNGATLFLYPSLYEGFGIPPLEAMSCGVPVITSGTTSIPEIVGDAALLIDPRNGEQLKGALMKLLNEEELRNRLAARGLEQARKFSWLKMAEATLEVYERVYGESQ